MSSTSTNRIAALLLNSIPAEQQVDTVRRAVRDLDAKSDEFETNLAAALLTQCPDVEAQDELIHHLESSVFRGDFARVAAICKAFSEIRRALLGLGIQYLSHASRQIRHGESKWLAVSISHSDEDTVLSETDGIADNLVVVVAQITAYLQFIAQTSFEGLGTEELVALLAACCTLVGVTEKKLCMHSRDCISELLRLNPEACTSRVIYLWDSVSALVRSESKFHKQLGYTLWLRWAVSQVPVSQQLLEGPEYWDLLRSSLHGRDSERQKSSLQVFRASIELAIDRYDLVETVFNGDTSGQDAETVKQHYSRFCTVYETIVLGRYLNQVQECEADLDFLASPRSAVKAPWLFTLLASALDPNMQESLRRFIGTWVMRSTFRTDSWKAYTDFFQDSFIVWAQQGSLFTSSLRYSEDRIQCTHGEQLANYIFRLTESVAGTPFAGNIIDVLMHVILGRQNRNFAYSRIYLLEGFSRAMKGSPAQGLNKNHIDSLSQLSTVTGLPEIARDYVHAKCLKILHDLSKTKESSTYGGLFSIDKWTLVQDKIHQLSSSSNVRTSGSIASWGSHLSKRDIHESKIIQECLTLASELQGTSPLAASDACRKLDDIWNEVEYLEFPKDLLITLSETVLNDELVVLASKDDTGCTQLAETISKQVEVVIEMTSARSYLLPPLLKSIRRIGAQESKQLTLVNLENVIVWLAENPPTRRMDLKFEDATAALLRDIAPEFHVFNYQYYFGPRESYGIVSLLDLVSRLSTSDLAERIMKRLLRRWVNQKIPPPSVSPWKNTLQLQIMLVCSEHTVSRVGIEEAKKLLKEVNYMLSVEPLPRYRFLLEWMIARIYIHHPLLSSMILEELKTKDHHSNPKFLASLMKIAVRVARSSDSNEEFASQVANVFIPLAASSKIIIRHEAQWQIPSLLEHGKTKSWTRITGNAAMLELNEFIQASERFGDPPPERTIDTFDPIHDHTLTNLVEGRWFGLDDIEKPLCHRTDFEQLFATDAASGLSLPPPCMPLGAPIPRPSAERSPSPSSPPMNPDQDRRILQNIDNISRALGSGPGPTALQTKGNAYLSSSRARHTGLLVVGSLVDNAYNLGGLSRVAEVFGAGSLYVANTAITGHRDFTNVSVSSHLHLPIRALPAPEVAKFLAQKRREEGFVVVGIEQTDRSVRLGSAECVLPEKCVLVMGGEREGIPALVLGECDLLVEIPQVGVTRSLNVQTAAGIVLCEYAKQHRLKD